MKNLNKKLKRIFKRQLMAAFKKRNTNWKAKLWLSLLIVEGRTNRLFNKNKRIKWGAYLTAFYLGLIFVVVAFHWYVHDERLGPNEIGDMLAGIFGPVAFLWLILGYLQQGDELRQSNVALRLQAKELSNSSAQQEAVVRQMEYELSQKNRNAMPRLKIINLYTQHEDAGWIVRGTVENNGQPFFIKSIVFCDANLKNPTDSLEGSLNLNIESGETRRFGFRLGEKNLDEYPTLVMEYLDSQGNGGFVLLNVSLIKRADLSCEFNAPFHSMRYLCEGAIFRHDPVSHSD